MTKSRKIEIALQLTLIIIGIIAIRSLSLTGFATFDIQPSTISIDGNFNDWTSILSDPTKVVYDGPWSNLTDLDHPKWTSRDLTRFAATQDSTYMYFYFQRVYGPASVDFFVYMDANNNGLMETGEPLAHFSWTSGGAYSTSCGIYSCSADADSTDFNVSDYDIDCSYVKTYWLSYFTYIAKKPGGDNITSCGDGCTMPGTARLVRRNIEKLTGSNSSYLSLETRFNKSLANISGNVKMHIASSLGQNIPCQVVDNMKWYALTANITPADTTPPIVT
jgi:hypothetical protein